MWIFMNDAMLSIVEDRDNPDRLLVRARLRGDIKKVFPKAKMFMDLKADYIYRAYIPRVEVAAAIASRIDAIDYGNFKDSIAKKEKTRKDWYSSVWQVGFNIQEMIFAK